MPVTFNNLSRRVKQEVRGFMRSTYPIGIHLSQPIITARREMASRLTEAPNVREVVALLIVAEQREEFGLMVQQQDVLNQIMDDIRCSTPPRPQHYEGSDEASTDDASSDGTVYDSSDDENDVDALEGTLRCFNI